MKTVISKPFMPESGGKGLLRKSALATIIAMPTIALKPNATGATNASNAYRLSLGTKRQNEQHISDSRMNGAA